MFPQDPILDVRIRTAVRVLQVCVQCVTNNNKTWMSLLSITILLEFFSFKNISLKVIEQRITVFVQNIIFKSIRTSTNPHEIRFGSVPRNLFPYV